MGDPTFVSILDKLLKNIIEEKYEGFDPYDVLSSPIFKLPILKNNHFIRFYAQQVFRRIPINLRNLLGIKKEFNPVTGGLCIQGFTELLQIFPERKEFLINEIKHLINRLIDTSSKNYSGICWGYNFDWEARYAKIPKFCPTVVATGIIINSLFKYWNYSKDKVVAEIIVDSSKFVLNDLNRSYEGDTFCFSYSPFDFQKVYNATMKGARLLAQAYYISGDELLISEGKKTVDFVVNNQHYDGSWFYSKGDKRQWIDNFHTAYVLDSLEEFIRLSKEEKYNLSLKRGLEYYLKNLFTKEGLPKYYSHKIKPLDSTAFAQSIITLMNFGFNSKAKKVYEFALKELYNQKGYFNYQKNFFVIKIPYIRWSHAWFLVALSLLAKNS